jgi:hypothetical protein
MAEQHDLQDMYEVQKEHTLLQKPSARSVPRSSKIETGEDRHDFPKQDKNA